MPIEIGELEINAHIEEQPAGTNINHDDQLTSEEIIREAVERVMEILRRKAEL